MTIVWLFLIAVVLVVAVPLTRAEFRLRRSTTMARPGRGARKACETRNTGRCLAELL